MSPHVRFLYGPRAVNNIIVRLRTCITLQDLAHLADAYSRYAVSRSGDVAVLCWHSQSRKLRPSIADVSQTVVQGRAERGATW
jgi:hypothetical protein